MPVLQPRSMDGKMPRYILPVLAALSLFAASPAVYADGTGMSDLLQSAGDNTYRDAVKAVEAKQYRTAIDLLDKVIEKKPNNPDALNYLGFSHRKLGEYGIAVTYYKRALALEPSHRGANEYLGEAYVELGNIPAAEERLTALAKICGTDCNEYRDLKAAIDAGRAKAKQG